MIKGLTVQAYDFSNGFYRLNLFNIFSCCMNVTKIAQSLVQLRQEEVAMVVTTSLKW